MALRLPDGLLHAHDLSVIEPTYVPTIKVDGLADYRIGNNGDIFSSYYKVFRPGPVRVLNLQLTYQVQMEMRHQVLAAIALWEAARRCH